MQLVAVPFPQVVGDDLLDTHSAFTVNEVVLAVALRVHIVRPHIAPDFGILITHFEPIAFGVSIVLQVDGVICKAIAVGSPLSPHILSRNIILLSALQPVVIVLHHLPPPVLPFKLLDSLPFQLLLLALLFFLSFHFVVSSEVFLEPLQSVDVVGRGLFGTQEARSPSTHSHSHRELA